MELSIRKLEESDFACMEAEWNILLKKSDSNPLFLGWLWQYSWWKQWGIKRNYELFLLVVEGKNNQLYGIAPLYRWKRKYNILLEVKQIQFIGSSWGGENTVRSEYLDFIVDKDYAEEVAEYFMEYILDSIEWDLFIIEDINTCSPRYRLVRELCKLNGHFQRIVRKDIGIYVDVAGNFENYIRRLKGSARRKIYNKRHLLDEQGNCQIKYAKNETDIRHYIKKMNRLHYLRWEKSCFQHDEIEFHVDVSKNLAKNKKLKLSLLTIDDQPISVLYNLCAGKYEYNIQAGFNELYNNKLSLGAIHLGYSIERAFNDKSVNYFDLLAGSGKRSFYKKEYSDASVNFYTIMIIRHSLLKNLEHIRSIIPGKLKRLIRKLLKLI